MHQTISLLSDTEVLGQRARTVEQHLQTPLEDHNSETTEAVASQTGPKRMGMAGGRFSSNLEGY